MPRNVDKIYQDIIKKVTLTGDVITRRNGKAKRLTALSAVFHKMPVVSLRKTFVKGALREWEAFMAGATRLEDFHPSIRSWWEPFADENGNMPFSYGKQFRYQTALSGNSDQIESLIDGLKNDPFSSRHRIGTWNRAEMSVAKLPNCHTNFCQFFVNGSKLDMMTVQGSCDLIVGVPHNWVQSYGFLMWVAAECGLAPGKVTWHGGDCHIYESHEKAAWDIIYAKRMFKSPKVTYQHSKIFKADNFDITEVQPPLVKTPVRMVP